MSAAWLLAALLSAPGAPQPGALALRPLGDVDAPIVARVAESLRERFGLRVVVLDPTPLPRGAYYVPRARYRAEGVLAELDRTTPPAYAHVLGVTTRDISTTKGAIADWGVLGVARLRGRPAVVSTYRLRAGGVSSAVFFERLRRVAAHEVAHAFGLPHCDAPRCLMNSAGGHVRSVDAASDFCPRCRRRLAALAR